MTITEAYQVHQAWIKELNEKERKHDEEMLMRNKMFKSIKW